MIPLKTVTHSVSSKANQGWSQKAEKSYAQGAYCQVEIWVDEV